MPDEPKYFCYQGSSTIIHGFRAKARVGVGRGRVIFKSFYISSIRDEAETKAAAIEWSKNASTKASTRPGAPKPTADNKLPSLGQGLPEPIPPQPQANRTIKAEPVGDPIPRRWIVQQSTGPIRFEGYIAERKIQGQTEKWRFPITPHTSREQALAQAVAWQNMEYNW